MGLEGAPLDGGGAPLDTKHDGIIGGGPYITDALTSSHGPGSYFNPGAEIQIQRWRQRQSVDLQPALSVPVEAVEYQAAVEDQDAVAKATETRNGAWQRFTAWMASIGS